MRIGVTGHQDIPTEAEAYVRSEIKKRLRQDKADLTGITALAAGSDQIFARVVLEVGGKLVAVVPCRDYSATFVTENTLAEYTALISKADRTIRLPFDHPSETAFLAAGRKVVDCSERLLAIWDGEKAKGKGGTADIVEYAKGQQVAVDVIWPSNTSR